MLPRWHYRKLGGGDAGQTLTKPCRRTGTAKHSRVPSSTATSRVLPPSPRNRPELKNKEASKPRPSCCALAQHCHSDPGHAARPEANYARLQRNCCEHILAPATNGTNERGRAGLAVQTAEPHPLQEPGWCNGPTLILPSCKGMLLSKSLPTLR